MKKITMVYFKVDGEPQRLKVTKKTRKKDKNGNWRHRLYAVTDTGKRVSRQVSAEGYARVKAPE